MGTLVFQATLGGAINLIGPNTASTVNFTLPSADGTSGQALSTNGSGTLAFGTLGILGGGTGLTSTPANGALDIGNGTGFTRTTLTAGTNVTITNAAGAITIAASGGGGASAATPTALGTVYGLTTAASLYTTALGYSAGPSLTGVENVGLGAYALFTTSSGTRNTAVGVAALYSNTASNNSAFGNNTLQANTTGANNSGFGFNALYSNTTASNSTAVGYQAAYSNTTATNCAAVGYQALYSNTTVGASTAIGYQAGYSSTGGECTFIGYAAGQHGTPLTTGNRCTYVGAYISASAAGVNNEIVLGQAITGKGANTFYVSGSSGAYNHPNTTTWSTTSDQRLKKNIVDNNDGLDKITSIRVRNFEYRVAEEITELPAHSVINKTGVQLGVIAQELQAVLPECVKTESTGVMSVDADNLTWYMINAIKELKASADAVKAEFDAYKASHP